MLLGIDSRDGELILLSAEGKRLDTWDCPEVSSGWSSITQGPNGEVYAGARGEPRVAVFGASGEVLRQIEVPSEFGSIIQVMADRRGFWYALGQGGVLGRFDRQGRLIQSHPVPAPQSFFLSRVSSNERFLAATRADSSLITVFQSASLDRLVTQDLGFSASGLLNSEKVAPDLVYMTDPHGGRVVTYRDYGRGFHFEREYRLDGEPSFLSETPDGILVVCRKNGRVLRQSARGEDFVPFVMEGMESAHAVIALEEFPPHSTREGQVRVFTRTGHDESHRLFGAARELGPALMDSSEKSESLGALEPSVFANLARHGFLHLTVPREVGGEELPLPTLITLISRVAEWDSASGWACSISCAGGYILTYSKEALFNRFFSDSGTMFVSGSHAPTGRALPVEGGFQVEGSWTWCSFADRAEWLMGNCMVDRGTGFGPGDSSEMPETRIVFFPRSAVKIEQVWDAVGMCGTGSQRVHVESLFVPESHTVPFFGARSNCPRPLYRVPPIGLFSASIAAVAVGIANAAWRDFEELVSTKVPQGTRQPLAARSSAQTAAAQAIARIRGAEALLRSEAERIWALAEEDTAITPRDRALLRLACTQATQESAAAVRLLYDTAGGTSVFRKCRLQKHFRDIHVVTQHMGVAQASFETLGSVLTGHVEDSPFV